MGAWSWVGAHRRGIASVAALSLAGGTVVALAATSPGYTATRVSMTDSGVWVTKPGQVGRLNTELKMLDQSTAPQQGSFDVVQDGLEVFRVGADNVVTRIDPARVEPSGALTLPPGFRFDARGGIGVVWEPATGKAWVRPINELFTLDLEAARETPDLEVGAAADAVVGVDGTAHVVSGDKDVVVSVSTTTSDPAQREPRSLGIDVTDATITAVGSTPVVLDGAGGRVVVPGGEPVALPKLAGAALQQASEASRTVAISADGVLGAVSLEDGTYRELAQVSSTGATRPARIADLVYATWNVGPYYVNVGPQGVISRTEVDTDAAQPSLRVRTNGSRVAVNDEANGQVWVAEAELQPADDNWEQSQPAEQDETTSQESQPGTETATIAVDRSEKNRPPVAAEDEFGSRAQRATILPVLENDADPDGDVLVIEEVTGLPESSGRLELIRNGEALQFTPDASVVDSVVTFSYTLSDGRGEQAEARVAVAVFPSLAESGAVNGAPAPVPDRISSTVVQAGSTVQYNVLGDWRDPEGDPLQLVDAASNDDSDVVRVDPAGTVTFIAGQTVGRRAVSVTVTDGTEQASGTLNVEVRSADAPLEPTARPDHAVALVGQTIELRPLLNDNDPDGDPVVLSHIDDRTAPGLTLAADQRSGTVQFTAEQAGSYSFLYYLTGNEKPVPGVIRVDVRKPEANKPPVPVLDVVALEPNLSAVVDVLANDYDPDGDVLVLTGVQPQGGLSIAVREHRVLEIRAPRAPRRDITVIYEVSDGNSAPVQATMVVRPPVFGTGRNQPPIAAPDEVAVRVGDVATIHVLANDTDPDGDQLLIDPEVTLSDGAQGLAFVAGDTIRFLAGAEAGTVRLTYSVSDGQDVSSSRVTVRVRGADTSNQPPLPRPLEARAVSTVDGAATITVPLDGIDPDGDSVRLTGFDVPAPQLGSVEVRDDTIIYTPRAGASGTDVFGYQVTDALGAVATGRVRVGVVPPSGANQSPTPVDDVVEAPPGRTVTLDVLANDSDPDGQRVRFSTNPEQPAVQPQGGAQASLKGSRIQLVVPPDGQTVGVVYWVEDGAGGTGSATLSVTGSSAITNLAPIARDDFIPTPDLADTAATVAVLENDEDADASPSPVRVTRVLPDAVAAAATVSADGQNVTVQLLDRARVVPYEITDGADTAIAFIRVPALPVDLPPVIIPGSELTVDAAGPPVTFDLASYVRDPEGNRVRIGAATKVQASGLGDAVAAGDASITYTPPTDRGGTAAITFEVIDGATLQDSPNRVLLTLPVTVNAVENTPPVVRDGELQVAQGEDAASLDITTLVTDDPDDTFTVSDVVTEGAGIEASVSGTILRAQAGADVPKGTTARVTFQVVDEAGENVPGTVTIRVTGSTKPLARIVDRTIPEAAAGTPVTVRLADQVSFNPFPDGALTISDARLVSGEASVVHDSGTVTVTPSTGFSGQVSVLYTVLDQTGDADRAVDARIVVTVQAPPDKPGAPSEVASGNRSVTLSWAAPAANGSPITAYTVSWTGGSRDCGRATECEITGLTNGTAYRFTVVAQNAVGASPASDASPAITPDIVPGSPPTPSVVRPVTTDGGELVVSWARFANEGSSVTGCELSNGQQTVTVPCDGSGAGSYPWTGLQNGQAYSFKVRATNSKGFSEWSGTSDPAAGTPAGRPRAPGTPAGSPVGGEVGKQIEVRWGAADGFGAPVTEYVLTVLKNGAVEASPVFPGGTTSATIDVTTNGANYTFRVMARNAVGDGSSSGESASVVPFGAPAKVAAVTATPGNQSVTLAFSDPSDNGQAIAKRQYQLNGGAATDLPGGNVVSGLANGTSYTFAVRACNTYCGPWSDPTAAVVPFGPPGTPSVNAVVADATQVTLSWAAPAPNGRDIVRVQVSINGGAWTDQVPSGSTTVAVGRGGTATIVARAVDSANQTGPNSATASATTSPPPPAPTVTVFNDRGHYGIVVANWPHDGLIGCFIGAPVNNWQRNIMVTGGSGSNASQVGTGTTWFYRGPTTVDCEGVIGTG